MHGYRAAASAATPDLRPTRHAAVLAFPAHRPGAIVDPIEALRLLRRDRLRPGVGGLVLEGRPRAGAIDPGLVSDLAEAGLLDAAAGELTLLGADEADRLREYVSGIGEDADV